VTLTTGGVKGGSKCTGRRGIAKIPRTAMAVASMATAPSTNTTASRPARVRDVRREYSPGFTSAEASMRPAPPEMKMAGSSRTPCGATKPQNSRAVWYRATATPAGTPSFRSLERQGLGAGEVGPVCAEVQDEEIRSALQYYTLSGPFGQLLDADRDVLGSGRFVTFETENLVQLGDKAVVAGRIHEDGILAGVQIKANELFFLAASKFPGRYYVINEYGECSATDDRVVAAKVAQVQVYRMQKEAA